MNRFTIPATRIARWCNDILGIVIWGLLTMVGFFGLASGIAFLHAEQYPNMALYALDVFVLRIGVGGTLGVFGFCKTCAEIKAASKTRASRKALAKKQREVALGQYAAIIAGEPRNQRFS